MWRSEDDALLTRLEDEALLEALFDHHVGRGATDTDRPHPRAAGLFTLARTLPGGDTRDVAGIARVLEAAPMRGKPPALLHHLALYFGRVADVLERRSAESAARARVLSLAAWLALEEEGSYVAALAASVGAADTRTALGAVADLGRRAETTSRDLAPSGRAALLSLASIDDAVRLAGVGDVAAQGARSTARRARAAAVDAALAAIDEAFEDAGGRGELARKAGAILERVLAVWTWSAYDEAVEYFAVERLATVAWDLYRARKWDDLRALLDPFRPLFDRLALRIENDPAQVAYAAACAQMFVFLADVEKEDMARLAQAERAVRVCPTHRNGRLVLSGLLCDHAAVTLRTMIVVARRAELERVEAMVARAEAIHPGDDVDRTKAMLARAKRLPVL